MSEDIFTFMVSVVWEITILVKYSLSEGIVVLPVFNYLADKAVDVMCLTARNTNTNMNISSIRLT
jgi:hypothetical protein